MKIEIIDSLTGGKKSVNFAKSATFQDVIKHCQKIASDENYHVTYGGQDIKRFGASTIESRVFPESNSFYITYQNKKLKNPVPALVPKIKIQIVNAVNGQIHPLQVKKNITFEDIFANAKELAKTEKCTVTFAGQDIKRFGKNPISSQVQLYEGMMKFYISYPRKRPNLPKANNNFPEEVEQPPVKEVYAIKVKVTNDEDEFTDMEETPLVMLPSIPVKEGKVVIDMSWGYSSDQRDFTDAACLIFAKKEHIATVNMDSKSWFQNDKTLVTYSGRGMNDNNKRGFHTIDIHIYELPEVVTHLFMTMSAWSNTDLSGTKHPSLRFFDSENDEADISNTVAASPPKAETIIMSYMERDQEVNNNWKLLKSGQTSRGNAIDYDPVIETIQGIISGEEASDDSTTELMTGAPMPMSINRLPDTDLESAPVEIVFSFDTTGSMYSYLEEVRKCVHDTITELMYEIPTLRVCVFAHGDYCDTDVYVTKYTDFSTDKDELCEFVDTVEPTHGGDAPECYELVLHEARTKLSWSPSSQKSLVMIGDAIPHENDEEQNYLSLDWRTEAQALYQEKGVRIYAIQCNDESDSEEFWKTVATIGHGKHLGLNNFEEIVKLLKMISKREGAIA